VKQLVLPEIGAFGFARYDFKSRGEEVMVCSVRGTGRRGYKWGGVEEHGKVLSMPDWAELDEEFLLLFTGSPRKNHPTVTMRTQGIGPIYRNLCGPIAKKQRHYAKKKSPRAAEITRSVFIVLFAQYGIDVIEVV